MSYLNIKLCHKQWIYGTGYSLWGQVRLKLMGKEHELIAIAEVKLTFQKM